MGGAWTEVGIPYDRLRQVFNPKDLEVQSIERTI
jgi:hypothetical protein